jgi:hypothetical protein
MKPKAPLVKTEPKAKTKLKAQLVDALLEANSRVRLWILFLQMHV